MTLERSLAIKSAVLPSMVHLRLDVGTLASRGTHPKSAVLKAMRATSTCLDEGELDPFTVQTRFPVKRSGHNHMLGEAMGFEAPSQDESRCATDGPTANSMAGAICKLQVA